MGYQDYTPMANKYLLPDGSITTFDNVEVLPADAERAALYLSRTASAAKWLMPDGSIVSGLPVDTNVVPTDPIDHIHFDNNILANPTDQASLYWDKVNDTLAVVMNEANGVILQIGQEMFIRAINKSGFSIADGAVVIIDGADTNFARIALADADNYINSSNVIGVATQTIANDAIGYVTIQGVVRGLNTNAFNAGDILYLSTTAGTYSTAIPAYGAVRLTIGRVIKKDAVDGWILVNVQDNKYMFGNPNAGNYSYFEDGGVLVARGGALTYRDEYAAGDWIVPSGATAPDIVDVTIAGVAARMYTFDGNATIETLGNTFEIPHDTAIDQVNAGTHPLEIHIHGAPSNSATGIVRFAIDVAVLKAQAAPIALTQVVITRTITANQQNFNLIFGGDISLPAGGFGIGDLLLVNIKREPANVGDTYGSDFIFFKAAIHIPLDTLGSRQRYVK